MQAHYITAFPLGGIRIEGMLCSMCDKKFDLYIDPAEYKDIFSFRNLFEECCPFCD